MSPPKPDRASGDGATDAGSATTPLSSRLGWVQWISAAAAILIAVFVISSSRHERGAVVMQLRERNRLKMRAAKDHIEDFVGKIHMCLRTMSRYPHVLEINAESTAYLDAIFEANYVQRHVHEIYVIQRDFSGRSPPLRTFERGDDAHDEDELHSIVREADEYAVHLAQIRRFDADPALTFQVSDPVPLCTGTPGRVFSVPIRSGDRLLGIVAAMLPSQLISEELESSSLRNAVLLARESGSFDVCTDFPEEMEPWFHEHFDREGVHGFFEQRENAFYADRYAALWTPVHFPGDRHWRIAFLYDEPASLAASGVGSGLTGWGTAGLVLLLGGAVIILCKLTRARERSEQRARRQFNEVKHIYNTSPIGLCFLDRDLRFIRINEQLARVSGRPASEHIGRPFRDAFPQIAAQVEGAQRKVLATGEIVSHVEVQGADTNGTQRVWLVSSHPMRTDGASISGVSVVVQDITMRVHAEEQARQRQAELAHMTRLGTMGEMASGLAHELNQPLASIVNYIQACAMRIRSGSGEPRDLLEDINLAAAQAQRAGTIIDHLRRVVRKREPRPTRVNLNHIVRDAAGLMKCETRPSGLEPRFELRKALPAVEAECIQIEQVIVNLMRNSVDALRETDPRERELVIRTSLNSEGSIVFSIRDTGSGLKGESLLRAFDPYYTTKQEGMGMGLSISRSIIEGHGGRLWAKPNPGRGTTFMFTLPVNGKGGHHDS